MSDVTSAVVAPTAMPPAAMAMMKNRGMTCPPFRLPFERVAAAPGCEACRYGTRRLPNFDRGLAFEVRKPPASGHRTGHSIHLDLSGRQSDEERQQDIWHCQRRPAEGDDWP